MSVLYTLNTQIKTTTKLFASFFYLHTETELLVTRSLRVTQITAY